MKIPFLDHIIKAMIDAGIAHARKVLDDLRENLDADGDGIKDFVEYENYLLQIRASAYEFVEAIDFDKLSEVLARVCDLAGAVKGVIDINKATAAGLCFYSAAKDLIILILKALEEIFDKDKK